MALQTDERDEAERAGPDAGKRYLGKFPGLVRDSFDPEERGRVRIYCPEVMGDIDSEDYWLGWAEADAPLAGHDQGMMMVPPDPSWERRDPGGGTSQPNETRVWVEFRDGDPRRPIYSNGGSWLGEGDFPHSKPKLADSNTGGDESTAAPNRTSSTIRRDVVDRVTGETVDGPDVKEPQPSTTAQYPYNYVTKFPGGHIVEFDNTPGGERIRLYHPSGTSWEINESGTRATKITGKESTFISGDMQCVIKGGSTLIVEGVSHYQHNKSSTSVFGDDVLEVIQKSRKTFITGGWEIQSGGQFSLKSGNIDIESTGAVAIIGASAVNIGTDDYAVTANKMEMSGVMTKLIGQLEMIVKGLPGVQLEALTPATHPIYASLDVKTAIGATLGLFNTATATATGAVAAVGTPANAAVVGTWMTAVLQAFIGFANAFIVNTTIHKVSKT